MGIFNRKVTYAVHFHVGAGSDKNILACAAKNQEYLISNQELTKENEKLLMQELQAIIDEQKTDDIKAIVKLEKEKLKNYDKIKIEEQYIHEDFTTLNDVSASLPSLEIKVQRINDNLIFVIDGKAFFDEYFCTIECEYPLENIKKTLKEIRYN